MHVLQTAGEPPSKGSTILAIIGCTQNSRKALRNKVMRKSKSTGVPRMAVNQISVTLARTPLASSAKAVHDVWRGSMKLGVVY
jgi:hypothetical protein